MLTKITAETYDIEVLGSERPVLVKFYADWCGPCKVLAPVVKEIAEEQIATLKVVEVDADAESELVERFGVRGLPTVLLIKNGEVVERVSGYNPKTLLMAKLGL